MLISNFQIKTFTAFSSNLLCQFCLDFHLIYNSEIKRLYMLQRSCQSLSMKTYLTLKIKRNFLRHEYIKNLQKKMLSNNQKTLALKSKIFLKQAYYTLVQGTKDLWNDSKWLIKIYKQKSVNQLTAYEKIQIERITFDLLKFIPYSLIIIIPFAQLSLPIILWMFPNAIPSFYLFDTAYDKRIKILQIRQQQNHAFLINKLLNHLRQYNQKQEQFTKYDSFKKNFFQVIDEINTNLNFHNFTSDQLIQILFFLGRNFRTGTICINKIVNLLTVNIPRMFYKIFIYFRQKITKTENITYKDPFFIKGNFKFLQFNYFPFEFFKKQLLIFQIKRHFRRIKYQDQSFQKYGMNDIIGYNVKHFARQRGIAAISCYETQKNIIKNDWVKYTTHPKFDNDNAKLWYSVMLYYFTNKTNKQLN